MVDNNISFLDTNLMRLTMELVEWMELEMIDRSRSIAETVIDIEKLLTAKMFRKVRSRYSQ